MRVNKAKRRLLRWHRYLLATGSQPTSRSWNTLYHTGHAKAYSDVTYAKRWSPKGIRTPWVRTTYRPGA